MPMLLALLAVLADDWPAYQADAGRSGYTTQTLSAPLELRWKFHAAHPPVRSWPQEPHVTYDRVYQPVVAGGRVYFGSSADGKVYALDAATGEPKWAFFTGGPVRCAPAVSEGRLFVGSDDGFLYCLAAGDGSLVWKKRAGPDGRMVLGNGAMVSRWPVRGGPAVKDGTVYFAAGIWPADGVFLYALRAATGDVVWVNETTGTLTVPHPHGSRPAAAGLGFQGYVACGEEILAVSTGRAIAAVFRRTDGAFLFHKVQSRGGTDLMIADELVYSAGYVYTAAGRDHARMDAGVAGPEWILTSGGAQVAALDRQAWKDAAQKKPGWAAPVGGAGGAALIQAGRTVVTAGKGKVALLDSASRSVVWTAEVGGEACGLAAADGRLYVSTDAGEISCFGAPEKKPTLEVRPRFAEAATPFDAAADEILRQTGVLEGFALDLGCDDGSLSLALAKKTKLRIYAVDPDPAKVREARRRLDAAGLYGARVTVHEAPLEKIPYPKYFANVIVSARSVRDGAEAVSASDWRRALRPWGGAACFGRPGAMRTTVRGALEGAGQWTHSYADAANTLCSDDARVGGPLVPLWYHGDNLMMPNRHGRASAPLFAAGRMYVLGLDALRALDAYNGRVLWDVALPGISKRFDTDNITGTAVTGGLLCATEDSVFVRREDRCLRIDGATGKTSREFKVPGGGPWGYLAVEDGLLLGSAADPDYAVPHRYQPGDPAARAELLSESKRLFALELPTGAPKWTFAPEKSVRHNAVAAGGGRVYLIDREPAQEGPRNKPVLAPHPPGRLVCLEAATGKALWARKEGGFGTVVILSRKHDVVLVAYQPSRFGFCMSSEVGDRMAAFRAGTGEPLWERTFKKPPLVRPMVNDRTVYTDLYAVDLLTGEPRPWAEVRREHGCGIMAASRDLLVFRSSVLGYVDLAKPEGVRHFGGLRPGCWINAIPAGGMVLVPDYSSRCTCAYLNKATVALQSQEP
jgi:outer membrane protein assembly factor BamB